LDLRWQADYSWKLEATDKAYLKFGFGNSIIQPIAEQTTEVAVSPQAETTIYRGWVGGREEDARANLIYCCRRQGGEPIES